jgi:hypothetical protein
MQDSSREERARRIIQWSRENRTWTGNYDFFETSALFDGPVTLMMVADPLGLPPILKTDEILQHIFRSPILLERACEAGWLAPIPDLEEPYFSRDAAYSALDRLLKGDKPARLAKEPELKSGEPEIGKAGFHGLVKSAKAAESLGISVRSLHDYSERGIIPFLKIGKHRQYNMEAVMASLERDTGKGGLTEGDINDILR